MWRKHLIAVAVAGALGCPAGALAGSGTDHSVYNETFDNFAAAPIEIGDGILATVFDEEFDGQVTSDAVAVGGTPGSGGSGSVAFSSDGGTMASEGAHESRASALANEAYLVPAPLAHNDGTRYWKTEVSASNIEQFNRLRTENVYVMMPIDDAIVDPTLALTAGPDALANAMSDSESTG